MGALKLIQDVRFNLLSAKIGVPRRHPVLFIVNEITVFVRGDGWYREKMSLLTTSHRHNRFATSIRETGLN